VGGSEPSAALGPVWEGSAILVGSKMSEKLMIFVENST
jgi:hypothetical protein